MHPSGDLDLASAQVLADEIERARSRTGVERIVIDMSAVPFVDSTGLRILIEAAEGSREQGIEMTLERPSAQFLRLVELTKTDSILQLA